MSWEKGLVSVIIPVWNREDLIVECVTSVLKQTYTRYEIIVVDDGSTDGTVVRVKELQGESGSRISVFSQQNSGVSVARTSGLKRSKGEYIQFLDSDDLIYPDKLESQVADLKRNVDACLSYCVTKETNSHTGEALPSARASGQTLSRLYPHLLRGRLWGTLTPLYRRSAVEEAGAYFQPFKIYEDWEFESRIGALNKDIVHNEQCLAEIRKGIGRNPSTGRVNAENTCDLCAVMKSVYRNCPSALRTDTDRNYFARSAFFYARQAYTFGTDRVAVDLLELASNASTRFNTSMKIQLFEFLSMVIDPARLARLADRIHSA